MSFPFLIRRIRIKYHIFPIGSIVYFMQVHYSGSYLALLYPAAMDNPWGQNGGLLAVATVHSQISIGIRAHGHIGDANATPFSRKPGVA